jgi:hypothetical protein
MTTLQFARKHLLLLKVKARINAADKFHRFRKDASIAKFNVAFAGATRVGVGATRDGSMDGLGSGSLDCLFDEHLANRLLVRAEPLCGCAIAQ